MFLKRLKAFSTHDQIQIAQLKKANCIFSNSLFLKISERFSKHVQRNSSESDDPFWPIAFKFWKGDPFTWRCMVKSIFVDHDSHMSESIEKDKCPKLKSFITIDRFIGSEITDGTGSCERKSRLLKNAPNKTRAIISSRTVWPIHIRDAESWLHGSY